MSLYPAHLNCYVSGCTNVTNGRVSTVPICTKHGLEIAMVFRSEVLDIARREERSSREDRVEKAAKRQGNRDGSLVYYVEIGGYIKIGYSTRLRRRFSSLRADRLLAIEPGGPELEHQRHVEFALERIDMRRENFRPSDRLRAHIDALHAEHGLPLWATVPATSVVTIRQAVPKPRPSKESA